MKKILLNLEEELHKKMTTYCYQEYIKTGKKVTINALIREQLNKKFA